MVEANNQEVPQADVRIRDATIEDAHDLTEFQCDMALETENKTLDKAVVRPAVEFLINNPKFGRYFVAYDENDPDRK